MTNFLVLAFLFCCDLFSLFLLYRSLEAPFFRTVLFNSVMISTSVYYMEPHFSALYVGFYLLSIQLLTRKRIVPQASSYEPPLYHRILSFRRDMSLRCRGFLYSAFLLSVCFSPLILVSTPYFFPYYPLSCTVFSLFFYSQLFITYWLNQEIYTVACFKWVFSPQSFDYNEKSDRRSNRDRKVKKTLQHSEISQFTRIVARLTAIRSELESVSQSLSVCADALELPFADVYAHRRHNILTQKHQRLLEKLKKITSEIAVLDNQSLFYKGGFSRYLSGLTDPTDSSPSSRFPSNVVPSSEDFPVSHDLPELPAGITRLFLDSWQKYYGPTSAPEAVLLVTRMVCHARNLQRCTSITHFVDAFVLFLATEFPNISKSFISECLRTIVPDQTLPEVQASMPTLKQLNDGWNDVRNLRYVEILKKLIIVGCFFSVLRVDGSCHKFMLDHFVGNAKNIPSVDILSYAVEAVSYIGEKASVLWTTGDVSTLWTELSKHEKNAVESNYLISQYEIMMNSSHSNLAISVKELKVRLTDLIASYLRLVKTGTTYERALAESAMRPLSSMLTEVDLRLNANSIIKRPFSLLLYGKPGVGKSSLINKLWVPMARANKLPVGEQHQCILNTAEKYDSNANSQSCFVLDDLASRIPGGGEATCASQKIIQLINNVASYAVKADVASKGRILLAPDFVFGTTNVPGLNANLEMNEPQAIYRRFNYRVDVKARPELCRQGETTLDPLLSAGKTDVWLLTVTRYSVASQPSNSGWLPQRDQQGELTNASLDRVNIFLNEQSSLFFRQQELLVQAMRADFDSELCKHGRWPDTCKDCNPQLFQPIVVQSLPYSFGPFEVPSVVHVFFLKRVASWYYTSRLCKYMCFVYPFRHRASCLFLALGYGLVGCAALVCSGLALPLSCCSFVFGWVATSGIHLELQRFKGINWAKAYREHYANRTFPRLSENTIRAILFITTFCAIYFYLVKTDRSTVQGGVESKLFRSADCDDARNHYGSYVQSTKDFECDIKTITLEDFIAKLGRHLGHADFNDGASGTRCDIIPLKGTYWLAPYHVVRRNFTKLVVTKGPSNQNGSSFSQKIDPTMWTRIGKTDLAVINLAKGGTQWDCTGFFPAKELTEQIRATLIHKNESGELLNSHMDILAPSTPYTADLGGEFATYSSCSYATSFPTFCGLCMSPVVARIRHPTIVAIHSAGVTGKNYGIGHMLTRDSLRDACHHLASRDKLNLPTASLEKFEVQATLTGFSHYKVPLNYQHNAELNYFGVTDAPRRAYASSVLPSPLAPHAASVLGIEPKWGPPPMRGWKPWSTFVEGVGSNNTVQFDPTILSRAYNDYSTRVLGYFKQHPEHLEGVHVLSDQAAIDGTPGVLGEESIDLSTGMGFSFFGTGKKSKYFDRTVDDQGVVHTAPPIGFFEKMEEIRDTFSRSVRLPIVFQNCLKDEIIKTSKNKVRVFSCAAVEHSIVIRQFFLPLSRLVRQNNELFECSVGMNCYGMQWQWLYNLVTMFGRDRVIAGDYKAFDQHMPSEVMLLAFEILICLAIQAGYTHDQLTIMRTIASEICFPFYESDGSVFEASGSNPSGHPLTVIINSIANSLYLRYVYYAKAQQQNLAPPMFHTLIKLQTLGDDNIMGVSPQASFFTGGAIMSELEKVGVIYTRADKSLYTADSSYDHISQATYMKRHFVYSNDMLAVTCPLAIDSIHQGLFCFIPSKSLLVETQVAQKIEDVMRESFHHGRAFFDFQLEKLRLIAALSGFFNAVSDRAWVSYDARLCEWNEKYRA